jgi:hypothetical protein
MNEFKHITPEFADSEKFFNSLFASEDVSKLNKLMNSLVIKKSSYFMDFADIQDVNIDWDQIYSKEMRYDDNHDDLGD